MKAFLIDPKEQTVTEVETEGTNRDIYRLIDAELFDVVRLNDEGDCIYVDDGGLSRSNQSFFQMDSYSAPLAGKGLVLGCDCKGETRSVYVDSLQTFTPKVRFISRETAIELGQVLDNINAEFAKDHDNYIAFPVADIIRSAAYSDESDKG